MRPYILEETNWKAVQDQAYQVAILPWGATEAHNYHMPYGTDNYQVEYVAAESAEKAWGQGGRPVVLPGIHYGVNTGQLDVPFCMNMLPSTQLAILKDIVDVLQRHGVHKLIILNGHGGNDFKSMIRELSISFPQVFVCWVNWYRAVNWSIYFEDPGDHAGEMETSAVLHIAPHLVRPLQEAGPGKARKYKPRALREGWAVAQREWTKVTADTGVGNPYPATAEKGKKYLDACIEALAEFYCELGSTPRNDLYTD